MQYVKYLTNISSVYHTNTKRNMPRTLCLDMLQHPSSLIFIHAIEVLLFWLVLLKWQERSYCHNKMIYWPFGVTFLKSLHRQSSLSWNNWPSHFPGRHSQWITEYVHMLCIYSQIRKTLGKEEWRQSDHRAHPQTLQILTSISHGQEQEVTYPSFLTCISCCTWHNLKNNFKLAEPYEYES